MPVSDFLKNYKVDDIPIKKGKIVQVKANDPLLQAFAVLIDGGVLSVPVYDDAVKGFIGFLDVRDLVAFAVQATNEHNESPHKLSDMINIAISRDGHASEHLTVKYLCKRNVFKPLRLGSSLKDAAELLKTVRRVPIVDADGNIVNIVSQSSLMEFLLNHKISVPELSANTIESAKIGSSPVLMVKESTLAVDAFRLIDKTGRSGIAIVDDTGVLTGNTSASDVRLFFEHHETLNQPILDLMNKIRRLQTKARAPSFTCHSSDTIEHVISKMVATHTHRVFVVDDNHRPIRVVSITDVLKCALNL